MGLPEYEVWVVTTCIMFTDFPSNTPIKQTLLLIHFLIIYEFT